MIPRLDSRSGQSLLIGVLLASLLFISVPVIIFFNQINTVDQQRSEQRVAALVLAKEGLAYAKQILSEDWTHATNSQLATTPDLSDCVSGATLLGIDGSHFKISCDYGLSGENYQVHVISTALEPIQGIDTPMRALEAYISKTTLGVSLPNDIRASVALEMVNAPAPPAPNSFFAVHWGPFSVFDQTNPTNIAGYPIDIKQFPRKFLVNGLTTRTSPSDYKEFWQNQSLGISAPLNDTGVVGGYLVATVGETINNPTCNGLCSPNPVVTGGKIDAKGNMIVLDSLVGGPNGLKKDEVVYIIGDAEIDNAFHWDAGTNGALIVTGNLTINTPFAAAPGPLRYPPTAALEYPYTKAGPCQNLLNTAATTCPPTGVPPPPGIQFHGFLWVKGNLIVAAPNFNISGVVLVGDPTSSGTPSQLVVQPNANVTIYYDDQVNRAIRVNATAAGIVQLQIDSFKEIPAK